MASKLEGHKIIIVFAIAGIVISMAIVLFIKKCCTVSVKEGFDSSPASNQTSCPRGSKSYYDKNSNLMCCQGNVNGHECEGNVVCTFSINTEKIPSCSVLIKEDNDAKAAMAAIQAQTSIDDCLAKCKKSVS
jgi:hypothetical protein